MGERARLSEATVFEVLSSPRRRYVLYALSERGDATVNEVATQVAAWEDGISTDAVTSEQRKRVYVSLYQTHVPALAEAGVVEHDGETGTVSGGERLADVERYLGIARGREGWPRYYLGLAAAGAVVVGVVWVAGLPAIAAALLVVGSFAALALAHATSLGRPVGGPPPEVERPD